MWTINCHNLLKGVVRAVFGSFHWKCIRAPLGEWKIGANRVIRYQILTPNKLDLSFRTPNDCAKFHRNRPKIATVGVTTGRQTDRQTQVILYSVPCYAIAMGHIIACVSDQFSLTKRYNFDDQPMGFHCHWRWICTAQNLHDSQSPMSLLLQGIF